MKRRFRRTFPILLALACSHSDSFVVEVPTVGPAGSGADIQLTFNTEQNYWPAWTQDGRAILYAFVDDEHPTHRCLGLILPMGGTRRWQLCDNRAIREDTLSSYSAFALDTAGRLLVAEAVAPANSPLSGLPRVTLWLADTARPYVRTVLLTLPAMVGHTTVTWLSDISWTGPGTFIALGQQFASLPHCVTEGVQTLCPTTDSIFSDSGGVVVRGAIASNQATLDAVSGTDGATSFSLAEAGSAVVFTVKHDLRLFRLPAVGGVPTPVPAPAQAASLQQGELIGVSCKDVTCVVAKDGVFLSGRYTDGCLMPPCQLFSHFFSPPRPMELHSIALNTGADVILRTGDANIVFVSPRISPASSDIVAQVGGAWGHLQTFATAVSGDLFAPARSSVLHLYSTLIP
jgi:hypothetical protein